MASHALPSTTHCFLHAFLSCRSGSAWQADLQVSKSAMHLSEHTARSPSVKVTHGSVGGGEGGSGWLQRPQVFLHLVLPWSPLQKLTDTLLTLHQAEPKPGMSLSSHGGGGLGDGGGGDGDGGGRLSQALPGEREPKLRSKQSEQSTVWPYITKLKNNSLTCWWAPRGWR